MTDRYDYDAFGSVISQAGSTPNVYLYSGEQSDPNLGFYYLRARYYSGNSGRFLTLDPLAGNITDPPSLHKYSYAGNDPANKRDPSGQQFTLTELSISISIETTLQAIQTIYYKRLIKFGISALRCTYCLVNPGYKLEEAATDALFSASGDSDLAIKAFQQGEALVLAGYQALGKAAKDALVNSAIDFLVKDLQAGLEATSVVISDRLFYYDHIALTVKPESLVKLWRRVNKTVDFANGFFTDEGGAACKVLWIADLASAFF